MQAWQVPGVSERAATEYEKYTRSVQEAFASPEAQSSVGDAFHRFAEQLQKAWTEIDPAAMTPETMAAIAEGILWVTGVAGVVRRAAETEL